ncbi:ArsC/Spx/MgsR family protein [Salinisphaera aquimarina]|uniref:ArsC/Spx/MgsR family protein n=1 Tax=Salinisphaera aquimarina TaxID=2094031 RepID=A0ABV7EJ89_9GAMM
MRLYHNPDCSKSRAALALLRDAGHEPTIVDYLSQPPDTATLDRLLELLDVEPDALVRRNDPAAAQWVQPDEPPLDRNRVIEILTVEPALLQRPILEVDDRALIARPPERVFELVDAEAADE